MSENLKYALTLGLVDKFSAPGKKAGIITKGLTNKLRGTRDELKQLNQQSKQLANLGGLQKKLGATNDTIAQSQERLRGLKTDFEKATKAGISTKRIQNSIDSTHRKINRLGTAQAELRQKTNSTRNALKTAGIDTSKLGKANDTLAKKIQQATSKMDLQSKKLSELRQSSHRLNGIWKKMKGAAMGAGIVMAGVGAPMLATAANFEQGMSTVAAITQATGEDFKALRANARKLGETTSFSASESAEGMKFLGMAGFKTTEIIAAMPGVLNLAKASATDLGRASDISSDILSGFGLEASQMGRVGDVLTKTFTSSNTNLEQLGEAMKYVGPVARQFGTEIEDVAAMAGLLGNVGIKGSQAGTTMRAMMLRLAAPGKRAKEIFEELGIKTTDASGNMRGMTSILSDMQRAMKGMGNGDKLSYLKDIFGEEPAAGVAELLSKSGGKIDAYAESLRNAGGTSDRIAKQMGNNANGGIKQLQSAVEGLSITVGDLFLPMLTQGAKKLTGIVRVASQWAAENPGLLKGIIAITAGGIAFVGAIATIGLVIPPLIAGFGLVASALGIIKVGLIAVKVLAMANPIGLAIVGIAAAATLIVSNWESIGPWFKNMWDGILGYFNSLPDGFTNAGKEIIAGLGRGIDEKMQWVKDKISGLGEMLPDWLRDKLDIRSPSRVFAEVGGHISEGIGMGVDGKQGVAKSAVMKMGAALPAVMATSLVAASPQMVQAGGLSSQSAAAGSVTNSYVINVHAAPGMDEVMLANLVDQRIRQATQSSQAASRRDQQSSFSDQE